MRESNLTISYQSFSNTIKYFTFEGKQPGPTLVISGGMHGNEVNGIYFAKKIYDFFINEKIEDKMSGKIILIPVLNPSGFKNKTRYVFDDGKDLNRSFGKSKPETYSEHHAKVLWDEIFSKCDYGIDLHDSGGPRVLLPHSRIHKNDSGVLECSMEMGQLFGTEIILERQGEEGMLAVEMKKQLNKTVLTVEVGGAQRVFYEYEDIAIQGIKNVLTFLNICKYKVITPERQYVLKDRFGLSSDITAIVELDVDLGDHVKTGQKIGRLYNPETFEISEITSPFNGVIFSKLFESITLSGKDIISVLENDKCKVGECYKNQFTAMPKFEINRISL